MKITITQNGPYLVEGSVPLAKQTITTNAEGESVEWREGETFPERATYALCRCGQSSNKPYCDGTHQRKGFDGTETANRAPYLEQAQRQSGPTLDLTDNESLCAFARFCDPEGQVWNLVEEEGERAAGLLTKEAGLCPSGRLVAWDRDTNVAIEPHYEPSIGLIEDPKLGVSGPIWVRGGIPIVGADAETYEVRNRVTLCRCGASGNKPFCDGSHASIGFKA
jgi:CDGSH-type Zn-finger protein